MDERSLLKEVREYIEENIHYFHDARLKSLQETDLKELITRKNPYLFRAKNILTAPELISSFLDAKLSSSEEEIFGNFLEELAIFVAKKELNAVKSSTTGIDFEFTKNDVRYLVTVKSGVNWGNNSQWIALVAHFGVAKRVLHQSQSAKHVEAVLGVCYGNRRTGIVRGSILQVVGQNFWFMISGKENFYKEIIIPLGYKAREKNEQFAKEKAKIINKITKDLLTEFCDSQGNIDWDKLVELNSGNLRDSDRQRFS